MMERFDPAEALDEIGRHRATGVRRRPTMAVDDARRLRPCLHPDGVLAADLRGSRADANAGGQDARMGGPVRRVPAGTVGDAPNWAARPTSNCAYMPNALALIGFALPAAGGARWPRWTMAASRYSTASPAS